MSASSNTASGVRAAKSARLEMRVSPRQKQLFEEAAALTDRSVSEFVTHSAQAAALAIVADRTRFVLPPDRWTAFAAAIEAPSRVLPRLGSLLSRPSVLDRE